MLYRDGKSLKMFLHKPSSLPFSPSVAAADPLAALPCAKLNVLRQAAPGEPLTPDLCLTAEEMDFYEQENPMTRPQLVQLLRQTEKFGILWKNYMFYK